MATREAYGAAIARLGANDDRVVALDADVGNSTFSEKFEKQHPERFFEAYIAEQVMIGAAMGFAARGAIPFPSTFARVPVSRLRLHPHGRDQQRNIKMAGTHAGVSIGEDGPSQMALEDLAMMRAQPNIAVLYPCDAVSTDRLVERMAYHGGPAYIRTSRPKTPVIYGPTRRSTSAASTCCAKRAATWRRSIGAGVTVFEALEGARPARQAGHHHPRHRSLLACSRSTPRRSMRCARETKGRLITVEDHYVGGGIGDAVAAAVAGHGFTVHRLAVREIPRSGAARTAPRLLRHLRASHRRCGDRRQAVLSAFKAGLKTRLGTSSSHSSRS